MAPAWPGRIVTAGFIIILMSDSPSWNSGARPTALPPRRILIIDDNADTASTLALLLEQRGSQTRTASDGLEALEVAEQFRPDVALLDIGLPKLNGYDVCRRIREKPGGKKVLLVAVSGWGKEEDRRKSREAGFDAHLVKPAEADAIMRLACSPSAVCRSFGPLWSCRRQARRVPAGTSCGEGTRWRDYGA